MDSLPLQQGLLLCRDSASGFLADLPRSSSSVLMSWDESAAEEPHEEVSWNNWLATELGEKLVGVQAKTSRAWVETSGLRSANMVKGRIRCEEAGMVPAGLTTAALFASCSCQTPPC